MRRILNPRSAIRSAVVLTVLLGGVLGACGSDDSSSPTTTAAEADGSKETTTTTSTEDTGGSAAASLPDDPCSLLTDADIEALLGAVVPGSQGISPTGEDAPQFVSCRWGSVTDDNGMVTLIASVPSEDLGIDYLQTVTQSARERTPVEVGDEGELLDVFVTIGGGGTGRSIWFRQDGLNVLIGRSGDQADPAALEAVAQQVASRL